MNAYCGNNQNYYFSKKMEKERAERKEAIKHKEIEQTVSVTSSSLKFQREIGESDISSWSHVLDNNKYKWMF